MTTMTEADTGTRWLDDREQRAWRGFLDMHSAVTAAMRRQLYDHSDLTFAEYEVLVALSEAPEGALRSFEIAHQLAWEASRLSHQLRRMELRGMVRREECCEDARGMIASITDEGRAAIAAAAPGHVAEVRRVFIDRLSADQIDRLIECTRTILGDDPDGPIRGC